VISAVCHIHYLWFSRERCYAKTKTFYLAFVDWFVRSSVIYLATLTYVYSALGSVNIPFESKYTKL
jgi:hypothetical protein